MRWRMHRSQPRNLVISSFFPWLAESLWINPTTVYVDILADKKFEFLSKDEIEKLKQEEERKLLNSAATVVEEFIEDTGSDSDEEEDDDDDDDDDSEDDKSQNSYILRR